jgi:hypothetical protein
MGKLSLNSTSLFIASITYLGLFSVMMFIIRGSALVFSTQTIYDLILTAVGALIITATASAVASVFGSAGDWVYRGGLLLSAVIIFYFFMDKLLIMLPSDMPAVVSFILIIVPFAGLSWVLVDKIILGGKD